MERHLSTGVTTLVALMEASREQSDRPPESACPWLRLAGRRPPPGVAVRPPDERDEG